MLTVDTMIEKLIEAKEKGKGKWPIRLLLVARGIPLAQDIDIDIAPHKADGKNIWIWPTEEHEPEWMK